MGRLKLHDREMPTSSATDLSGSSARGPAAWWQRTDQHCLFYILFLCAAIAYFYFPWPITAFDTDLWYHLHGGRYIVEHGALPTDSSFISFITPPRP